MNAINFDLSLALIVAGVLLIVIGVVSRSASLKAAVLTWVAAP